MQRVIGGIVRTVDPLHRKPETLQVPVARDMHRLQVPEQSRTGIPRRMRGWIDDVVPVERAERDEFDVLDVEPRQELLELRANLEEALLAPADEVHLVDGDDQMRNPQQRGDRRVAAALFDHASTRVD